MTRRAGTILLTTLGVVALPVSAHGQSYGRWNSVFTEHTADAAALGSSGRGFLEYGTSDKFGYTAQAGIATLDGMLRVTYSHSYRQTIAGLGYARMLATKDAGKLGTLGAGVDLSAAMDFYERSALASRAARLSIPLSLRWGSPSRLSIAPYVAPYGEVGRETSYRLSSCNEGLFCSAFRQLSTTRTRLVFRAACRSRLGGRASRSACEICRERDSGRPITSSAWGSAFVSDADMTQAA